MKIFCHSWGLRGGAFCSRMLTQNNLTNKATVGRKCGQKLKNMLMFTGMADKSKLVWSWVSLSAFLGLAASGFWLLHGSSTNNSVLSPWQTIDPSYIYVFLATTLVAGLLIAFSTLPKRLLVVVLSVYGFLLYSYLPLSHPLLYGADGWRHLGEINRLLTGGSWREVASGGGGFLTTIGRLSYSGFWVLIAVLSKISTINALSYLRWLQPALMALTFPVLAFLLGRSIGLGRRLSLMAAWFCNWPFALQAAGAFTLPVNFWFPIFLAAIIILFREFSKETPKRLTAFLVWLALAFGYSLYPILYLILWALAELVYKIKNKSLKTEKAGVAVLGLGLVIPLIERVQDGSAFVAAGQIFNSFKQLAGNLTGVYLASGPRPHDIMTGNIFFNQIPSGAFVTNILTGWRWWLVVFMVIFLVVALAGIYRLLAYGEGAPQILALFSIVIFISYALGRYFIIGGQIITRRLDAVAALLAVFLFFASLEWLIEWAEKHGKSIVPIVLSFVLVCTLAITASYSLGPDAQTVALKDYEAMKNVAAAETGGTSFCVIADTYPLLALEGLSNKRIVGGGFPINKDFSQPERQAVLQNIRERGLESYVDINYALSTTGADHCWYVLQNGFVQKVGRM